MSIVRLPEYEAEFESDVFEIYALPRSDANGASPYLERYHRPLVFTDAILDTRTGVLDRSEGECGRIAESIDDLIHLLVYSICWHDYCDASQYTDISTLEVYANERHEEIASYTEMDEWETVVQALGMPLDANVAAEL